MNKYIILTIAVLGLTNTYKSTEQNPDMSPSTDNLATNIVADSLIKTNNKNEYERTSFPSYNCSDLPINSSNFINNELQQNTSQQDITDLF